MDDASTGVSQPQEHPITVATDSTATADSVEHVDLTDASDPAIPAVSAGGHPILKYTLARFGLLIAAGALCYLLGARGILLIVLAFIVSGLLSYVVLFRQRDQVGLRMGGYFKRMNQKIEASKTAEDDAVDQHSSASPAERDTDRQQ